jgi:WD40 repeat protein
VAFSPDGNTLASGGEDWTIKLWDVEFGRKRSTLQGHTSDVASVTFAPDGETLASLAIDTMVKLWETKSGQVVRTLGVQEYGGSPRIRRALAFSPDGRILATGGPHNVKLWNPFTGALYDEFHAHWSCVCAVAFSPEGDTLLTTSKDYRARLWKVPSEMEAKRIPLHPKATFAQGRPPFVAFHPHESLFLVGQCHGDGIETWGFEESPEQPMFLRRTGDGTTKEGVVGWSAAFLPDGKTLITCDNDNCWRLWDGKNCRLLERGPNDVPLCRLAVAPDGKTVAAVQTTVGSSSWTRTCETAKLWDVEGRKAIRTLSSPGSKLTRVAFSPDGKFIATCTRSGGVITI